MSIFRIFILFWIVSTATVMPAIARIPTQGLRLWLRADSGVVHTNGVVEAWQDVSGNGNHALQPNAALRPRFTQGVMNNLPAITFNNSFLDITASIGFQTVFIVANYTAGENFVGFAGLLTRNRIIDATTDLLYVGNTGTTNFWPTIVTNNTFINGFRTSSFAPLHQIKIISGSTDNRAVWDDFRIGQDRGMSRFWVGHILEILIFDRLFTASERAAIERYLSDKYAPPVSLGPDISNTQNFCPVTLSIGPGFTNPVWNTGQTTPSISVNRSGTYTVSARNAFGFLSSDTIRVSFPEVSLSHTNASLCYGDSIVLAVSGAQPGFSYRWNTGATTPSIRVGAAGTYTLVITDAQGCTTELSATVLIDDFSRQGTLGADRPFCMGDTLRMEHSAGAVSFQWSTGATTPAITITQPGTYWVHATSAAGCVARDTVTLSFGGYRPTAHFTATNACPGQPISFTDRSTVAAGSVVSWRWDFHDGQTSVERNPVHTPTRPPGTAPVTLQVTTDAGCRHSVTLPVRVFHNPQVSFTPHHACTRVPQPFTDTSTDPDGMGITSRRWLFPDGSTDTTRQASFTFEQTGSFPVTLQVTTAAGCTAPLTRTVLVRESPQIDFSWTTACKGEQVHFTELSSAPVWAPITAREWNFGDGNTSTRINPGHIFPADGVFPVTLTLTAANGCRISLTRDVTVHSIPRVDFAIADLCEGMPHRFTDLSTVERSTITRWQWNFGNRGNSTLQHPEFAFDTPGQYAVRLEVESAAGCVNTTTRQMQVYPAPRADFSFWPDMGASPLQVTFTNTSVGAARYLWDFGDGSPPSTLPAPVHTFRTDGRFTVQLIATSQRGCTDTLRRELSVVPIVMDVAVTQVAYTLQGSFMQITANLLNLGTRTLDTLMLDLNMEGRRPIRERWTGRLHSGDITSHTFSAMLPMRPDEQPAFICIAATTGIWLPPDRNPGNNTRCLSFNEAFQLLQPRPNPAALQTELPIVLPVEKQVHVALYDLYGNRLWEQPGLELEKGVNFITIPMHTLLNGIYMIHVRTNEETRTKRVMKMQ